VREGREYGRKKRYRIKWEIWKKIKNMA